MLDPRRAPEQRRHGQAQRAVAGDRRLRQGPAEPAALGDPGPAERVQGTDHGGHQGRSERHPGRVRRHDLDAGGHSRRNLRHLERCHRGTAPAARPVRRPSHCGSHIRQHAAPRPRRPGHGRRPAGSTVRPVTTTGSVPRSRQGSNCRNPRLPHRARTHRPTAYHRAAGTLTAGSRIGFESGTNWARIDADGRNGDFIPAISSRLGVFVGSAVSVRLGLPGAVSRRIPAAGPSTRPRGWRTPPPWPIRPCSAICPPAVIPGACRAVPQSAAEAVFRASSLASMRWKPRSSKPSLSSARAASLAMPRPRASGARLQPISAWPHPSQPFPAQPRRGVRGNPGPRGPGPPSRPPSRTRSWRTVPPFPSTGCNSWPRGHGTGRFPGASGTRGRHRGRRLQSAAAPAVQCGWAAEGGAWVRSHLQRYPPPN